MGENMELSGSEVKPHIMVVGSSNTDMVIKMERLPNPGETVLGGDFLMVPGGKGANQAVAAARLGGAVTFIARLGSDLFGDEALRNFQHEGIDTKFIVRDNEKPSGVALIFVDKHAENVIAVAPGANGRLSEKDLEQASEKMQACSVLVLQLEVPLDTVKHAAKLGREKGLKVILNPAPVCEGGLPTELLENVDVLLPNETEARMLLGMPVDAEIEQSIARKLLDLGVGSAIVTMGAAGALVVTRERVERVPSPKVNPVDTTAAGDAFTGAVAVSLAQGMDLFEAARLAVYAAALSVTKIGAQSSLPTAREVTIFKESA